MIKAGADNESSLSTIRIIDANIDAAAFGINGNSGNITIEATNGGNIELLGDGEGDRPRIYTDTFASYETAKGEKRGGDITIKGGNLTINNYILDATVKPESLGNGGNIIFNRTSKIIISIDTKFLTNTQGRGKGGDIDINATDSVQSLNSELLTQSSGSGDAGNVKINTRELLINNTEISSSSNTLTDDSAEVNGAQVTVSSKLGQAGNLNITADNVFLNRGKLTAETRGGSDSEGANITLNIKDLLRMRNKSEISAEAFDTADGGNITINNSEGFIVGLPFENNDINANADRGNGGNINITTQNIFGLAFRDTKTDQSDITASSKFGLSGKVTVNQLNVNPASSLVELPSTLVTTTGIKAGCAASQGNTFTVRSKGGLPESPDDLFDGNAIHTELLDLIPTQDIASDISYQNYRNSTSSFDNKHKSQNQNQIVEATGWIVDAKGNELFVAKIPQHSQKSPKINSASCKDFGSSALSMLN